MAVFPLAVFLILIVIGTPFGLGLIGKLVEFANVIFWPLRGGLA